MPTATLTLLPTLTPTATAMPTLTPTRTPIPPPSPTPVPTLPPLRAEITLLQSRLPQGSTAGVTIKASRPGQAKGTVGKQSLAFVAAGANTYVALWGVDPLAEPGEQPLRLTLRGEDGQEIELATRLQIVAATFEHEVITFEPSVAQLLDPKILEPENRLLADAFAAFTPRLLWDGPWAWPHVGEITSPFAIRRQYQGGGASYHAGLDLAGNTGDAVRAPAGGVVRVAEKLIAHGGTVVVDHGAGVVSAYYHLDGITAAVGQTVAAGAPLGRLGSTGLATGPHLHWELRVGGVPVSPQQWTEQQFP
jgi:murein DD-endopeptidase MepM/ murein hydrolase activator NlpD